MWALAHICIANGLVLEGAWNLMPKPSTVVNLALNFNLQQAILYVYTPSSSLICIESGVVYAQRPVSSIHQFTIHLGLQ